jgi:hypothetical protein
MDRRTVHPDAGLCCQGCCGARVMRSRRELAARDRPLRSRPSRLLRATAALTARAFPPRAVSRGLTSPEPASGGA